MQRILRVMLAVAVAVGVTWGGTTVASAHHATLNVSTVCHDDGTWTASWSIRNSESGKVMDITSESVTDFTPNPTPKSGTSTDATTHANSVGSVTANVTVDWVQHAPLSYSLTAFKPEGCEVPPPPTTTTTTPPPPPTTVPEPPADKPPVLVPPVVVEPPVPVPATPTFTG